MKSVCIQKVPETKTEGKSVLEALEVATVERSLGFS